MYSSRSIDIEWGRYDQCPPTRGSSTPHQLNWGADAHLSVDQTDGLRCWTTDPLTLQRVKTNLAISRQPVSIAIEAELPGTRNHSVGVFDGVWRLRYGYDQRAEKLLDCQKHLGWVLEGGYSHWIYRRASFCFCVPWEYFSNRSLLTGWGDTNSFTFYLLRADEVSAFANGAIVLTLAIFFVGSLCGVKHSGHSCDCSSLQPSSSRANRTLCSFADRVFESFLFLWARTIRKS